eukprot:5718811-Pleurochrysis_carterae.AAC.1
MRLERRRAELAELSLASRGPPARRSALEGKRAAGGDNDTVLERLALALCAARARGAPVCVAVAGAAVGGSRSGV